MEVVVAVGIFAIAIVGVIGLLAPTSKNITDVADSDAASRVITAIQAGLEKADYMSVAGAVKAAPGSGDPSTIANVFFANKDGSKVAPADPDGATTPVWNSDEEKFFQVELIQNNLSPNPTDPAAGFVAFTIYLRWPVYARARAAGPGPGPEFVPVDDSQKSVMVVPAAITR